MVTPKREVRISDELWERARAAAKLDSTNVSALIKAALLSYVEMLEDMHGPSPAPPKPRRVPKPKVVYEPESDDLPRSQEGPITGDKRSRVYHREVSGCPHKYKDTAGRCLACGYKR